VRFDTQFDAALCLSHIRQPGRFGVEVTVGRDSVRIASPLDAHAHVLQASAFLTGIEALKQREKLADPRVFVSSDNKPFVDAMTTGNFQRLNIPIAMVERLMQLRGNVVFEFNAHPAFHISLDNWLYDSPLNILDDLQGLIEQRSAA